MKTFFSIALIASMATVILSNPQGFTNLLRPGVRPIPYDEVVPVVENEGRPQIPDETKEIILDYVADKIDYPNLVQAVQTRASLFNLSAYLNTNRPANGTALTFVPLITLLSALFTGTG